MSIFNVKQETHQKVSALKINCQVYRDKQRADHAARIAERRMQLAEGENPPPIPDSQESRRVGIAEIVETIIDKANITAKDIMTDNIRLIAIEESVLAKLEEDRLKRSINKNDPITYSQLLNFLLR